MAKQYRVYMDVCCLNRPFDDWTQPRIRLEAEAVLAIAVRCQAGEWSLIRSATLESEINRTPDPIRKQRVQDSLSIAEIQVLLSGDSLKRTTELMALGFKSFDALHIASAEVAHADVLLTTDDRLTRKAKSYQDSLAVQIANPVNWMIEVSKLEGEENDDPS